MSTSRVYASALLAPLAEQLVDAAGITAGMRVLDVLAQGGWLSRRLTGMVLTAVEVDGDAEVMLVDELRAARVSAEVMIASPGALPFADGVFDAALSLLRLSAHSGGTAALGEMQRVAMRAAAVVEGDDKPAPEALLAAAWREVTGTVPVQLQPPDPIQTPPGWTTTQMTDVARFDGEQQLTMALFEHHALTADGDGPSAVRRRFAARLLPFQGADGTLRIPVSVRLLKGSRGWREAARAPGR